MLVSFVLLFAQILTMAAWGESNIKKTPEGKLVLAKLSDAGLFFLKWRAYADYKKELEFLRKCFGWLSIIFVCVFTVVPDSAKPLLSVYSISFMGLWVSIRIGTDVKGQLRELLSMAALLSCGPFLFLLMDWFHMVPYSLVHTMAAPLKITEMFQLNDFELTLVLSLMGAIIGMFLTVFSVIMFSIIPLLLLFVMVVVSRISRVLLSWNLNRARNCVALYVLVVGPTLLMLHAMKVF